MGTRSLTVFKDEDDKEIAVMYRQMDGYPDGHGQELAEFLNGIKIVNGIPMGEYVKMANGMECLAAQIVAYFKDDVGSIYLYPAGTRDAGEEYTYIITGKVGEEPFIRIEKTYSKAKDKLLVQGYPKEILKWINDEGEKD